MQSYTAWVEEFSSVQKNLSQLLKSSRIWTGIKRRLGQLKADMDNNGDLRYESSLYKDKNEIVQNVQGATEV